MIPKDESHHPQTILIEASSAKMLGHLQHHRSIHKLRSIVFIISIITVECTILTSISIILKTSGSGADGFERMCHHISISPTNNIWSSTVLGSMTLHWFLSKCHSKKPKNLQHSILQQLWSLVSSLKTIVKWLQLVTSDTSRWWSYRWWWWWWWSFQLKLNKIEI